jgi:cytidyltransferase-like protein
MTRYALYIGRWQPFHEGHQWLVEQKLAHGVPVWIAVRDVPPDVHNPYPPETVVEMIKAHYGDRDDVLVTVIPDIESVNYGRKVGYEINEWVPPAEIERISATAIRKARGDDAADPAE